MRLFVSIIRYTLFTAWLYEQHGLCLMWSRRCLPFVSTLVHPILFGRVRALWVRVAHLLLFCVVLYVFMFVCFCLSSSCVLCVQCCRCLLIIHSWLTLRFPLMLISKIQVSTLSLSVILQLEFVTVRMLSNKTWDLKASPTNIWRQRRTEHSLL